MKEVYGDLWEYPADVHIITTNGYVKKDGRLVMGRGCAREAMLKHPGLDKVLGGMVAKHGNQVIALYPENIWTMPVKHAWYEEADPQLIVKSAHELVAMADSENWKSREIYVLPRPGCGNGKLRWQDVKPLIEDILDDRFRVITWKE